MDTLRPNTDVASSPGSLHPFLRREPGDEANTDVHFNTAGIIIVHHMTNLYLSYEYVYCETKTL